VVKRDIFGYALQYASSELKSDREIILEAVKINGEALAYASNSLKSDRSFILIAVSKNGRALEFVSNHLKSDKDVVQKAIRNYGEAFSYASEHLQKDRDFIKKCIRINGKVFDFIPDTFKYDKGIIKELLWKGADAILTLDHKFPNYIKSSPWFIFYSILFGFTHIMLFCITALIPLILLSYILNFDLYLIIINFGELSWIPITTLHVSCNFGVFFGQRLYKLIDFFR
jgi:hypothetical protein